MSAPHQRRVEIPRHLRRQAARSDHNHLALTSGELLLASIVKGSNFRWGRSRTGFQNFRHFAYIVDNFQIDTRSLRGSDSMRANAQRTKALEQLLAVGSASKADPQGVGSQGAKHPRHM